MVALVIPQHLFLLNCRIRLKQARNFRIPRLIGKYLKGNPVSVTGSTKAWKALDEPLRPFDIAALYRICKVVKLNCQKATQLSQILNRPPCRGSAKLTVLGVDFCAMLK